MIGGGQEVHTYSFQEILISRIFIYLSDQSYYFITELRSKRNSTLPIYS